MVEFLFNTVIYVYLFLCLCIPIVWLCIFIVAAGILRLPWLMFFRAFSSVIRQMSGYNSQRRGTVRTLPKFLCCSMYCLFCVVLCIVCVYMCTVLLPPDGNSIAVNKYIISYVIPPARISELTRHVSIFWTIFVTLKSLRFVQWRFRWSQLSREKRFGFENVVL
jgi:hypothetical protein